MVDAEDLKSSGFNPCGFESLPPYWVFCYIKVEKTRTTPKIENAYEEAETAWSENRTVRQDVIKTSNEIGEGDALHPLATIVFSKEIKRVQVFDNEKRYMDPMIRSV